MIEVAYRQQKDNEHQSFNRSPKSNQTPSSAESGIESTKSSTSTQPQNTTFFGSGPEYSAPLQINPLKAPSSPLVSNAPSYPSLFASVDNRIQDPRSLTEQVQEKDYDSPGMLNTTESSTSASNSNVQSNAKTKNAQQPKRVRKGQKLEEIQPVVEESPVLQQIDSPFQLQEYLALLVRQNPHNVEKIVSLPQASVVPVEAFSNGKGKGKDAASTAHDLDHGMGNGGDPFVGGGEEELHTVDTDVWVYEQLRRIVADFTTPWLISLQRDCDRKRKPSTCDAMNADDWMYLCASHGEEKQCCAIDYIIHTLDGTTALLNSHRHFPSRTYIPTTSLRHFGSVSRRLSRIFVHAYEHHRDVFEACEAETSLYSRFLTLVQMFDLIAIDSLPQLGAGHSKDNVKSDLIDKTNKNEKLNQSPDQIQSNHERGAPPANRKLFDHNEASGVPRDAKVDEDEDDEVEMENQDQDLSSSLPTTRIQRSDSNASRITAIHIDDVNEKSSN